MNSDPSKFVFVSTNTAWGGSEILWSAAAIALARQGHTVAVHQSGLKDNREPPIQQLRELGCQLNEIPPLPMPGGWKLARFGGLIWLVWRALAAAQSMRLRLSLLGSRQQTDLVIISQYGNWDGALPANICRRMGVPYVLIVQKAADMYWPPDQDRAYLAQMYSEARWCFFVSDHNWHLTEEQLGCSISNASVVRNPIQVPREPRTDWPDESDGMRLACVGRLYPMEKGQDMLLRVLARDKWRQRDVRVTFYGEGPQRQGLEEMARYLDLTSVRFGGFVRDVSQIWDTHHALVLPSRCEGLPLVLVEAMMSGRVPIVTDVAGAREVVDDNETGFLAAPTEDGIDEALERAWIRRHKWKDIGACAAHSIREQVPPDPAATFADEILEHSRESPRRESPRVARRVRSH